MASPLTLTLHPHPAPAPSPCPLTPPLPPSPSSAPPQAMYLMAYRLSKLYEDGRMTHEQASLVKAWTSLRGRETVSIARELLGGNGILSEFLVAKAFCDMEAIYSYEVRGGMP